LAGFFTHKPANHQHGDKVNNYDTDVYQGKFHALV
jgi:hypothetical protein